MLTSMYTTFLRVISFLLSTPASREVSQVIKRDDLQLNYCVLGIDMSYVEVRPLFISAIYKRFGVHSLFDKIS